MAFIDNKDKSRAARERLFGPLVSRNHDLEFLLDEDSSEDGDNCLEDESKELTTAQLDELLCIERWRLKYQQFVQKHSAQLKYDWRIKVAKVAKVAKAEAAAAKAESRRQAAQKRLKANQEEKRRRSRWIQLARNEIPRAHRAQAATRRELTRLARVCASACGRSVRQRAMSSAKMRRDCCLRARRLCREIGAFYRQAGKVEQGLRRQEEKQLAEQRKEQLGLLEARRQRRKLNYLLTQTELYAHFMTNKGEQAEPNLTEVDGDDEDDDDDDDDASWRLSGHASASASALAAARAQRQSASEFFPTGLAERRRPATDSDRQPDRFRGSLKHYQLTGINWLTGLFDQGINGILADEMGLGKCVQTIAFLCRLAEDFGIWGPFLVVAPASTLHNWVQEFGEFAPHLKVIPYWGTKQERKVLRRYLRELSEVQSESDSLHVMITSYQYLLLDSRHLQPVRWQYLILDEAHAIKSASSRRWLAVQEFQCRNRLLLTGTPIQNNMSELWALLHFIMPTLFDSRREFYDWFAKDIESQCGIDEQQLNRLHLILKPFMLRRVKRDVELELADKINRSVMCDLSARQRQFYASLRARISIDDLLQADECADAAHARVKSLLNLIIQFRKVCNHPDLFDKREFRCCLRFPPRLCRLPKLVFNDLIDSGRRRPGRQFEGIVVAESLSNYEDNDGFGFLRLCGVAVATNCDEEDEEESNAKCRTRHRLLWRSLPLPTARLLTSPTVESSRVDANFHFVVRGDYAFASQRILHNTSGQLLTDRQCAPIQLPACLSRQIWMPPVTCESHRLMASSTRLSAAEEAESATSLTLLRRTRRLCGLRTFEGVGVEDRVRDSGKMLALDRLLRDLKRRGHKVLLYSQMTKMIDMLEDLMICRRYQYVRLDGSSRICQRRDSVADFQSRSDIFVFLLSTRAGGVGINLTAADTVIFYDSDWNPTVDQQAMDRAHRVGQTQQVTVYRLVTRNSIEERILQRAEEKSEIQSLVISGGSFKPDQLKSKEVVSLLLDDEEMSRRLQLRRQQRKEERRRRRTGVGIVGGVGGNGESAPPSGDCRLDRKRKLAWCRQREAKAGRQLEEGPVSNGHAGNGGADCYS